MPPGAFSPAPACNRIGLAGFSCYMPETPMPRDDETRDDSRRNPLLVTKPQPGVVVVVAAGRAASRVLVAGREPLEVGRGTPAGLFEGDDRMSRQHASLQWKGGQWHVADLGSRNGTYVNGEPLTEGGVFAPGSVIRVGRSLLWALDNVLGFEGAPAAFTNPESPVIGGLLRRSWAEIALASQAGDTLCLLGESGAGKEIAARAFHDARHDARAPFIAVNCAAIPEGLAERLLFGAVKGAYSGATSDVDGYVVAAHEGTLFLDEIAELDPLVQAKLLRVIESREVLPLGSSRPRPVRIAICVASHKELRAEVSNGHFREDLYFRLGRPEVRLPPLRERLDEMPWYVERTLATVDPRLVASVTFIEECMRRPWPGNVREFMSEVRRAAHRAREGGSESVGPEHLADEAGVAIAPPPKESAPARRTASDLSDEDIERALRENDGNVRGTARALGIHRNQLRRWLAKRGDVL